jgi:hypothetical protein
VAALLDQLQLRLELIDILSLLPAVLALGEPVDARFFSLRSSAVLPASSTWGLLVARRRGPCPIDAIVYL